MKDAMQTIVIIGAGFSGTLVAVQLLRKSRGMPLRIVLVERSGSFGPGVAYGNGSEALLLNVVAGRMSALPDEPSDFLRWARTKDPSARGESFLPRRMFGRYVSELLDRAVGEAGGGVELVRVVDEVVDVQPAAHCVSVGCRNGGVIAADAVVLAPGNFATACPSWCGDDVRASGRYIADPWRGDGLSEVQSDERVVIVGTGLTMMDVALSLKATGHRGSIDAVSRRGLMSQPHRHGNPGLAKLPDPLISRTYERVRDVLRIMRSEAERAEAMGGDWRDAVNAMRSITPALWRALDERERRRFLDRLTPFWNTHRHRAPQSVADAIDAMIESGQVRVRAARIHTATATASGIDVVLDPRGGEWPRDSVTLHADRVINCTGPTTDAARSGNALVERLLATGVMRPGPMGMGLDSDDAGRVVGNTGTAEPRMYLVGPARVGSLWETTAVPELRVHASAVAQRILEQLGHGPVIGLAGPADLRTGGFAGHHAGA